MDWLYAGIGVLAGSAAIGFTWWYANGVGERKGYCVGFDDGYGLGLITAALDAASEEGEQ